METLQDLTTLSTFEGTIVPDAGASSACLHHFGPMLTHPSRVTFPWSPLRMALQSYFSPTLPPNLDPLRIFNGWNGLTLILTAFKRLEVVESEEETEDVLTWLRAIKLATVRRSLECESFEPSAVGVLQDVLSNLLEPIDPSELVGHSRSRNGSLPYASNLSATSTSFERGSDSSVSFPSLTHSHPHSHSTYSSFSSTNTPLSPPSLVGGKRSPPGSAEESELLQSPMKKRRASLVGGTRNGLKGVSVLPVIGGKRGGNTVSTSALSSFADFSDHHDLDPLSSSDSSDSEASHPLSSPHVHSQRSKINLLAQRLSEVTGIPLSKCIETISRFPNEELKGINPHAEIPSQFLPAGYTKKGAGNGEANGHAKANGVNGHANGVTGVNGKSIKKEDSSLTNGSNGHTTNGSSIVAGGKKRNTSSNGSVNSASTKNSIRANSEEGTVVSTLSNGTNGTSVNGNGSGQSKKERTQRPHDPNRPNFSYSALIGQAILSAPDKRLRLAEIYEYVTNHYSYYKKNECGWQNSIRHNLSLQPVFKKVPDVAMPGKKGCFWTIIEGEEWRFAGGGWQKMEKGQQGPLAGGAALHNGGGFGAGNGHSKYDVIGKTVKGATTGKRKVGKALRKSIGGTSMASLSAGGGESSYNGSAVDEEEDRKLDEEEEKLLFESVSAEREEGDEEGDVYEADVDAEGEEAEMQGEDPEDDGEL